MSAAANAAGYLYVHGRMLASDHGPQGFAENSPERPAPAQSKPVKPVRTPKIEYRKRRLYLVPSTAQKNLINRQKERS
jgi:hypothetical protein